ncbi:MAG TPA: ribosome small subunit-dependent GTPase A [Pirellulales bacterium]|jgi:ribosome biogenesis GTPase|nr:ribosome small subunit-dependent GTPase A [Pirellulales bacterium]
MAKKQKKIRADFRKNRSVRTRPSDLTRRFDADEEKTLDAASQERISGKGDLTRKRTVVGEVGEEKGGFAVQPAVDEAVCHRGRVLSVHGLTSTVQSDDGRLHQCATRRLLKTLSTDQRHVVVAGDRVAFRIDRSGDGIIERVEPRHGVLARSSRGRQHILVANVDQILIISSAAEPRLKPHLIDRFLITAEQNRIRPVLCINKVDLVDRADLQPLVGVYSRMGYRVLLVSAATGFGVDRLQALVGGRASVVVGQSGVGKSSLLNAIQPQLHLRVAAVSAESQKGRHTTTTSELIPLSPGSYVIDTPGIRQFQLWDVVPEEIGGWMRDLRPYVSRCKFPNCTHTHEAGCAVKDAVADGRLDTRRYESYCQLFAGDDA